MRHTATAVLVFLVAAVLVSQQVGRQPEGKAKLDQLKWLVGSWYGDGLGGRVEEHWSPAAGATMMGTFRLVVEEQLRVIEYVMITQEESRIVYRFKHFNSDFTTWEAERPLEFDLIGVSDREAVFHSSVPDQSSPRRITYRLSGEDELSVEVAGSDEEGRLVDRFEIRYRKRPPS